MRSTTSTIHKRWSGQSSGHTLLELIVASVCGAVLVGGLASVMLIASHVAYTPASSERRTAAAHVINHLSDELRYATLIFQPSPHVLELVVADRTGNGGAERIRYEWSGTPGDPLFKKVNSADAISVLDFVESFDATLRLASETTTLTTSTESAEVILLENSNLQSGSDRDITATAHVAQRLNPTLFNSIPTGALSWNATKLDIYSRKSGSTSETLIVQLRSTGGPHDGPTSGVLGDVSISENAISASYGWNTVVFPTPVRGLLLHRSYAVAFSQTESGSAAKILVNDAAPSGVLQTEDAGASWQLMPARQTFFRLYGTYTLPGPAYTVTRRYATDAQLVLQTGGNELARIDARVPLANRPELLSAYWRSNFERDPTAVDVNGDGIADWAVAGGGSFDTTKLIGGVWHATEALETRPVHDFAATTVVEVRCRNTTMGGNGAVMRINADRQNGQHAPILVHVQRQADGSQTLTLIRKPSDAANVTLFTRRGLSSGFVRFQLTIVPEHKVVNLRINGEDQGSFFYSTYSTSSNDRFLTLQSDGSLAEFDYVEVRVAN